MILSVCPSVWSRCGRILTNTDLQSYCFHQTVAQRLYNNFGDDVAGIRMVSPLVRQFSTLTLNDPNSGFKATVLPKGKY